MQIKYCHCQQWRIALLGALVACTSESLVLVLDWFSCCTLTTGCENSISPSFALFCFPPVQQHALTNGHQQQRMQIKTVTDMPPKQECMWRTVGELFQVGHGFHNLSVVYDCKGFVIEWVRFDMVFIIFLYGTVAKDLLLSGLDLTWFS